MMVEGQKVEEGVGESEMKVNILQMEDNYAQIEFKDVNYSFVNSVRRSLVSMAVSYTHLTLPTTPYV